MKSGLWNEEWTDEDAQKRVDELATKIDLAGGALQEGGLSRQVIQQHRENISKWLHELREIQEDFDVQ